MDGQVTVKITMPKEYAEKFIKESDEHFYGSRFLNILYKDKMFTALMINKDPILKDKILEVRKELLLYLKYLNFWRK